MRIERGADFEERVVTRFDAVDARTRVEDDLAHLGIEIVHALGEGDGAELNFFTAIWPVGRGIVDFVAGCGELDGDAIRDWTRI